MEAIFRLYGERSETLARAKITDAELRWRIPARLRMELKKERIVSEE